MSPYRLTAQKQLFRTTPSNIAVFRLGSNLFVVRIYDNYNVFLKIIVAK